jgi:Domain of unknown function (DUF4190)/zinc-ribbon domain
MICTSCGTTNRDDAQFCRGCGTALTAPPRPSANPRPSEPPGYAGYQSQYAPGPGNPLQAPNYGNYQAPMPAGPSGKATASMILSILSLVTCLPLLSIPGMIMGKMEMNAIAEGRSSPAGLGYAKAGFWIGLISTILLCGGGIIGVAFGFLGSILSAIGNV